MFNSKIRCRYTRRRAICFQNLPTCTSILFHPGSWTQEAEQRSRPHGASFNGPFSAVSTKNLWVVYYSCAPNLSVKRTWEKMEKKRTATVFDIISKRKISIQVPHTEIVRWLVSRSQVDEICLFVHSKWIRMFVDLKGYSWWKIRWSQIYQISYAASWALSAMAQHLIRNVSRDSSKKPRKLDSLISLIMSLFCKIDRQKYSQKKNHVDVWKTCRTLIGKTKKIDAERKAHHRIKIQARCFSCKTSQQDASCLSSLSVSSASFSSSSNPSLVTSSSSSFAFFASVHLL